MTELHRKILIIDDDDLDRLAIERSLKEAGYMEVTSTATGEEGIYIANSRKPDLILCDIALPDADGFEICRRLRKSLKDSVKIIVMTGAVDALDGEKSLEIGAVGCVVKNPGYEELIEEVNEFFGVDGHES
ncbi:MAG: response regulator [Candidatus Omnitrophica bacterium]|nr:response regulator [Candidatus Omnitrophota bacterium]